jgi:methylated-DNA-[protein]-cysteine S-methyltransferase
MMTYKTTIETPVGPMALTSNGSELTGLFLNSLGDDLDAVSVADLDAVKPLASARDQITEYFASRRREFDIPLAPDGTPFQRLVWGELCRIPYGTTISYGELARRVGNPNASRAVGLANGSNPLAIIVPCHRVIGSSGKLTGYGGGLEMKRFLLDLERGESRLPL